MSRHTLLVVVMAVVALLPPVVQAQTVKTPVEVVHAGRDTVGSRFAFELKEAIRSSNSMRYVIATEADPRIVVHIVTVDTSSTTPGNGTAASVSIIYDGKLVPVSGIFLDSMVQTCGYQRVAECARGIAGDVDAAIEKLRKNWPGLAQQLR